MSKIDIFELEKCKKRNIITDRYRKRNKEFVLKNKKALLVEGVRQVGKTYITRKVLKSENSDYVMFYLLQTPEFILLLKNTEHVGAMITTHSSFLFATIKRSKTIRMYPLK